MNRKFRVFWDKHEGWVAPIAMLLFLWAGIKIGAHTAISDQALMCSQTISDMSEQIGTKDQRIIDKDQRLRTLQDDKSEGIVDAAKATAEAAANAAAAAQKSAEAAASAAGKTFETKVKETE